MMIRNHINAIAISQEIFHEIYFIKILLFILKHKYIIMNKINIVLFFNENGLSDDPKKVLLRV